MTNVVSFEQPSKVSYLKMLVCQNMNMPQLSNLLAYRILIQKTMRNNSSCLFQIKTNRMNCCIAVNQEEGKQD